MSEKSIDQNIFPEVMGTIARGQRHEGNRTHQAVTSTEGKCSGLLTDQTLNNCFINLISMKTIFLFLYIKQFANECLPKTV